MTFPMQTAVERLIDARSSHRLVTPLSEPMAISRLPTPTRSRMRYGPNSNGVGSSRSDGSLLPRRRPARLLWG